MADNVTADPGSGGAVFRTEDKSGVHTPVSIIDIGGSGSETLLTAGQAAMAGSVPVVIASDQSAVAVTVSGVATAANQATGNTALSSIATAVSAGATAAKQDTAASILTTIDADTGALAGCVGGTELQVDVVSSALPSGAATAANQSTGNTSLATIAGAVSGTEVQVDVVAAIPAGDNLVGRVKISDGTDVADVLSLANSKPLVVAVVDADGTQVTSFGGGGGGSGTEYTEDAAAASNPVGGIVIARRRDSLSEETSADGDNTAINCTSKGEVYVKHADAVPVTDNGGTLSIDDGGSTITVDGTVSVTGVATAAKQDAAAAILTTIDGDTGALAGCVGGTEIQVDIVAALPAGDNNIGNVDIASAIPAGTNNIGDVDIASIAAGDNNIGNVDVVTLPSIPAGTNNIGDVDVLTLPALAAGTNLIGKAVAAQDVDTLYAGTTALTVKYFNIDAASSGNNELVAAVSGKVLKVISLFMTASGAVDVYFNDGTANLLGGTRKVKLDNTGAAGAGGFALQSNPTGWFKTAGTNRPINLNLSGAVGVAGCGAYVEE